MATSWPILSVTIFLPLLGALFIMMMRGEDTSVARNARWVALWTTLITAAISLILVWRFSISTSPEFQFVERQPWLAPVPSATTWGSTASRCRSWR